MWVTCVPFSVHKLVNVVYCVSCDEVIIIDVVTADEVDSKLELVIVGKVVDWVLSVVVPLG